MSAEDNVDKLRLTEIKVQQVKEVMTKNIQRALDNGERIDHIEDQAEQLKGNAIIWETENSKLRRKKCLQHYRNIAICVFFVALFITVMVLIAQR